MKKKLTSYQNSQSHDLLREKKVGISCESKIPIVPLYSTDGVYENRTERYPLNKIDKTHLHSARKNILKKANRVPSPMNWNKIISKMKESCANTKVIETFTPRCQKAVFESCENENFTARNT